MRKIIVSLLFIFPYAVIFSSCSNEENKKTSDSVSLKDSESENHYKQYANPSTADSTPIILQVKVLEKFPEYSDLSKLEWGISCAVLSVIKGDQIAKGDTVSFGQTVYDTKDSAYNKRCAERVKKGTEFIVFLRKRNKDEITWTDSCFHHSYGGMIETEKQGVKFVSPKNFDEFVMTKMFIEENDSLKFSYNSAK